MRYTTLRVSATGVVLLERHCWRLAPEGDGAVEAFRRFAGAAEPGVYSVRADGDRLTVQRLAGSRLYDGIPARLRVSPVAGARGPLVKMPSPCPYDAVRAPGVATLLTTEDGSELLEACVAAVVGWDGERFVLPPADRPRVGSVTEQAIREGLPFVEAPVLVSSAMPVALVNAVKGICHVRLPGREEFPEVASRAVMERLVRETGRA